MDTTKLYKPVLQASTILLTIVLVWFSFIYYPKVLNKYKTGTAGANPKIVTEVIAVDQKFPIKTKGYELTYEEKSNTYYALVQGTMLDSFELNRQSAKLALKTALSMDSLCKVNVIYVSASGISLPQNLATNSDC
ncbi:MAG TPA: hypothetical protein VLE91_04155 [Candidatus Saccharimonadales bacterium]|nr:hypothetical protein [Candidatus Saccharimonadales bacterium]